MSQLENIEAIERRSPPRNCASTTGATRKPRDAVHVAIQDFLWNDATGLPLPAYTEDDVNLKTEEVFRHVFRAYPTVPSPVYS